MAQPDERHANRTASVLEWYDRHRDTTSGSNEKEIILKFQKIRKLIIIHS